MFSLIRASSRLFKWKENIDCKVYHRHSSFKSLHPFYLAVHPDLFNGYPVEQKTNEESLKVLHSYLNGLKNRYPVYTTTLTFYMKNQDDLGKNIISQVKFCLKSKSTSSTIRDIMYACNLPHHEAKQDAANEYRGWEDSLEIFGAEKASYASYMGNLNVGIFKSVPKLTLDTWVDKNQETVESNQKNAEPLRRGISKIMKELKIRYGVLGLSNGSLHYSFSMVYSGLKQLQMMLDRYFTDSYILKDRLVKFGHFNGLDQLGRVLFNINDVPSDWTQGLSLVSNSAPLLDDIKELENLLKQSCCGIKFIRPRGSHSYPVQLYWKGLDSVCSNLVKERGGVDVPRYNDILAICGWEEDFVGISTEGYVKVPLHVSRSNLLTFIDQNIMEIKNARKDYLRNLQIQQAALLSCKLKLGLDSLDKDFTIDTTQTVDACNKLELYDNVDTMKNWSVILSNYYSVSANGLVRIPWNFERENYGSE